MTRSNQYFINDIYHKKKYNNSKEIFSFLIKLLNKENKKDLSLIDVGCASCLGIIHNQFWTKIY